ncbi:uncharacterized protein LOC131989452 [Centropristis striata]|uniref:uncharacterized protein LOC131989452 n=1 Tax=Centropristis striata TaxID=184440 RepID=UPI0027E0E309|nr:uncharacterized protein LOC131989452 [Centropristis striata]
MVTKVVLLLVLFGVASSNLLDRRRCDPEPKTNTPTVCFNFKNINHLAANQTGLKNRQEMLERSVANLSSTINELLSMKTQTEMESRGRETQLEKHKVDIASLKREVQELVKHREREGGNFSEIEQRLDATERQLREKKAKLENLETETEAALNDTQRLLKLYKDQLSHLNLTAREIEVKVEARLDATDTKLEAQLQKIQNNSKALSTKLNEQKAEVDGFKVDTAIKFSHVDKQLKTQKAAVEQQKFDVENLKNDSAGMKHKQTNTTQQNELKLDVDSLKAEVYAKVAFSATATEGRDVFMTGPNHACTSCSVIFNKVFTNIGNAYNKNTGIFTAPLNGLYHFTFMTFGYNKHMSGAILLKNGQHVVSTMDFPSTDSSDTTSNTVILQLNVGDTVNIKLWQGGKIHTGVFTGFLLFPTA